MSSVKHHDFTVYLYTLHAKFMLDAFLPLKLTFQNHFCPAHEPSYGGVGPSGDSYQSLGVEGPYPGCFHGFARLISCHLQYVILVSR